MRKHQFEVTIDDGYDAYTYPLDVSDSESIHGIYEKLCKAYKVEQQPAIDGSSMPRSVPHVPDFCAMINKMAWHATDEGKFRRMERQGKVKMYHDHGTTFQEMKFSKKESAWTCKCGAKLEK